LRLIFLGRFDFLVGQQRTKRTRVPDERGHALAAVEVHNGRYDGLTLRLRPCEGQYVPQLLVLWLSQESERPPGRVSPLREEAAGTDSAGSPHGEGREPVFEEVRRVLAAEEDARRRLEAARQRAAAMLSAAVDEARRCVREVELERDAIARAAEAEIVARAEQEAAALEASTRQRLAEMRERASSRADEVVAEVVRLLIGRLPGDGR
jgi:vacuolar-type H+-ATPase subunit H